MQKYELPYPEPQHRLDCEGGPKTCFDPIEVNRFKLGETFASGTFLYMPLQNPLNQPSDQDRDNTPLISEDLEEGSPLRNSEWFESFVIKMISLGEPRKKNVIKRGGAPGTPVYKNESIGLINYLS